MKRTSESIKHLIQQELLNIKNHLVENGLKSLLVPEPILHMREWDYGKENEKFECWTIAIDTQTDTSIVFSDYGHGGWGLVSTKNLWFGMDSGWFDNLAQCYLDSFNAGELPIWCVRKETGKGKRKILTEKMKMDIACKKRDKLAEEDKNGRYHVDYILD